MDFSYPLIFAAVRVQVSKGSLATQFVEVQMKRAGDTRDSFPQELTQDRFDLSVAGR